jgi:HTH-type transcriptional regulator / antitoxin HipB
LFFSFTCYTLFILKTTHRLFLSTGSMAVDYTVRTRDQLKTLLVAFRKAGKQTQAQLAASLGVTQQALSALEGAPSSASFERILNLLSALNVDVVLRTREQAQKILPLMAMEPDAAATGKRLPIVARPKIELNPTARVRNKVPIMAKRTSAEKTQRKPVMSNLPTRKRDEW